MALKGYARKVNIIAEQSTNLYTHNFVYWTVALDHFSSGRAGSCWLDTLHHRICIRNH